MATHTITFSAFIGAPEPLIMYDDEGHSGNSKETDKELTTDVAPGDTIKWVSQGDISSFRISYASGNDIFQTGPNPQPDGSWEGVVANLPDGVYEEYNISYVVNGETYTQDPKLRFGKQ